MPIYAMMSGNTVSNVIVADDKEATEKALRCVLVEITPERPLGVGMTYNIETDQFSYLTTEEPVTE